MNQKKITVILPVKKYELLKILVKIKDTNFNNYINDLITKDLKLNIDKIKQYQKMFNDKS
ncbi:hypothetical protein J7J62_02275 [bacterium]|nr:hypothetical protein [bacterium]